MTSTKPVNVYVVLCQGTIDRKLESLVQDKGDAAELVLDLRLIGERTEEINLAELLRIAHREFDADTAALTVQTSAPAPDWKARVAARAARLAQTQRSSNLWSQF
ncbi:MAG: hypothetical protein ACLQU3_03555 [Limisphaerales bacterium]